MGINVYPVTKKPAQLERLVNVPGGTINALRDFEKRNPALIDPEANSDDRYKAYSLLDEHQQQMRTLEIHGLGKIPFGDLATILGTEHEPEVFSGLSDDPQTIAQILGVLEQQGYFVPDDDLLGEGICWS